MLKIQKEYNKKVLKTTTCDSEKEVITQNLALCTHAELSSLVNALNYKHHHGSLGKIDKNTILYESVDIVRYMLAILNVWDITASEFDAAFNKKDIYLHQRKSIDDNQWDGQPVAIVDIDDVLGEFRNCFASWLAKNKNINPDIESNEYYFIDALKETGENPEHIFEDFIKDDGFLMLKPVKDAKWFLGELKKNGYWVHLLTARPEDNLGCFYPTYQWLANNFLAYDDLSFSSEKFRWCAQSKYYNSGAIKFAIDDSPKHAMEYATHGIKCFVPKKSYNLKVWNESNIITYENFYEIIQNIL